MMNQKDLADTLLLIDKNLIDEKQNQKAAELLEKILLKHPRSAETHRLLGLAYWQMKRYDNALDSFIDALLIEPDNCNFTVRLFGIVTFYSKEKYVKKLEEAIDLIPTCIVLYNTIGYYYRYKKLFEEAISNFTKGIENMPNTVELYYKRADLYAEIGRTEDAIRDYEKALELDQDLSKNYSKFLEVAGLYLENKNFNQALKHLNNLFQIKKADEAERFEDLYFSFEREDIYKYLEICKSHMTHHPEDRAAEYCFHLIAVIFNTMKWPIEEQKVIEKETCR
jgi:tetratricopeptide (TPR) repeat protein